jgi:hypothetical protein
MTGAAPPARNAQLISQLPSTGRDSRFMETGALSQLRGSFETTSRERPSMLCSSTPPVQPREGK